MAFALFPDTCAKEEEKNLVGRILVLFFLSYLSGFWLIWFGWLRQTESCYKNGQGSTQKMEAKENGFAPTLVSEKKRGSEIVRDPGKSRKAGG